MTLAGFILYALGSAICWAVPTNMAIVLVGQFIKNIGGLPCAYVFMALFADGLDHLEWKSGVRSDGVAMSVYNILAVATIGVATSLFNALITKAGYIAPKLVDGVTIASEQSQAVKNMITFSFVGLETITGVILAILLIFLTVEKTLSRKQEKIREYQKTEAAARGEEWVAPEVRAAEEKATYLSENEIAFEAALKEKCSAKGLDFEKELADYRKAAAEKAAKSAEKKRLAEEKEKAKAEKAMARKDEKLAALSPEKRLKKEQKEAKRAEADETAWQRELAAGEAYRAKIKAELETKGV